MIVRGIGSTRDETAARNALVEARKRYCGLNGNTGRLGPPTATPDGLTDDHRAEDLRPGGPAVVLYHCFRKWDTFSKAAAVLHAIVEDAARNPRASPATSTSTSKAAATPPAVSTATPTN